LFILKIASPAKSRARNDDNLLFLGYKTYRSIYSTMPPLWERMDRKAR
jgi:hypothetical protein